MNLNIVLFVYLAVFLISYSTLKFFRYNSFSAFIIAVLGAQIVLTIIYPPTNDNLTTTVDSATSLYFFLQIMGVVLFSIYGVSMALSDYSEDPKQFRERLFAPRVYI